MLKNVLIRKIKTLVFCDYISDIDCFKPANGETITIKTKMSENKAPFSARYLKGFFMKFIHKYAK